MPDTQSVFDLIDQCEFSVENPFELTQDLFPILNTITSPSITKLFEKKCYNSWLIFGFDGESQVSVFYDSILQKFQDGSIDNYFGHLTTKEKKQIADNFVEIINDELRHRDIFSAIILKTNSNSQDYKPDYYNPECKEYVDSQWKLWDDYTLLDHLCPIVTGESYLLAAFVLFYKYTTNPYKKQIFKEFIQEESRHIAHFMNFMKKAKVQDHERPRYHQAFISQVEQKIKFEHVKFLAFLDTIIKDPSKKHDIIKMAYNTEFHHTFTKIFLKKSWQFYNIICPIDQDTYESLLLHKNNS
jgi:rubrerythrin